MMPYLADASAQAACDAVIDRIDAGTGPGYIEIRSGTRPSSGDATATGTLLATLTFSDPAFGATSTGGVGVAGAITSDTNAAATGTATWARVLDSDSNPVMDLSVGTTSAEVVLSTVSIVAGATVSLSAMTTTMPDGT